MRYRTMRRTLALLAAILLLTAIFAGCSKKEEAAVQTATGSAANNRASVSERFTERDLQQTADLASATTLTLTSGCDVSVTEAGVYVLSGTAENCTVHVNCADENAKVQLVLDDAHITNTDSPCILVTAADKVFVTTTAHENSLSVTGSFGESGDAVIDSKDDLTLNGVGTLTIESTANGVSSNDEIRITGGSYTIASTKDAIEAHDAISIADGVISINAGKDGLHAEDNDDDTVGAIYLAGGTLTITAAADAIQATTLAQFDGGTVAVNAREGIEATHILINNGTFTIHARDDGLNGSKKSSAYSVPVIEINGGSLTIAMAAGDTDAVDVNGNLIITGGTINITAQSAFDFDGTVTFTGGTVTVNGQQITRITASMPGGGMHGHRR